MTCMGEKCHLGMLKNTLYEDGMNSFQNESHTSVMGIASWYDVIITVFHA